VNEGKKISVITDHERSMDMIVDYLMAHPHVIEEVLQKIASYNASLN
jgi:membrane-bound lytic murein transglycosylase